MKLIILKCYTALTKDIFFFIYLKFFHLYRFLLVTGIIHKFKGFLK